MKIDEVKECLAGLPSHYEVNYQNDVIVERLKWNIYNNLEKDIKQFITKGKQCL